MYEDEQQGEHEILDQEDEHEDQQPVTVQDKAWGFWQWFIFIHVGVPIIVTIMSTLLFSRGY